MTPAVASQRSIFSKNHDYNRVFRVAVNTYVPIFRGLDARDGRKLRTDTHVHTHTHAGQPQSVTITIKIIECINNYIY